MKIYSFVFGVNPGQYPIGATLTDSIFKRKKTVSHFFIEDVPICVGAAERQDKVLGTFDLTGCSEVKQDTQLIVVFK